MIRRIIAVLALLCTCVFNTDAGVGLKTSLLSPRGDMGPYFKKAPLYELYYRPPGLNRGFYARVGIFFTDLTSRLDTFPIYDVSNIHNTVVKPGYLCYKDTKMYGLNIDLLFRVKQVGKFDFNVGTGFVLGIVDQSVAYGIETSIIANNNELTDSLIGFRPQAHVVYEINKHFSVAAEVTHAWAKHISSSYNYTHTTYGLTLYYYIRKRDE